MSQRKAIGIDFGTAYSCVAVFRNDNVEIIPNEYGKRTTPSYVAFTQNRRLIGDDAKNPTITKHKNKIFDIKRLIGQNFRDSIIQKNLKFWPFELVDHFNKPLILLEYDNQKKLFTVEEISAMILKKMKNIAENYLGEKLTDAVITIPATFNRSQRQIVKDAASIAGLNVLRLVSEPVATTMAFCIETNISHAEQKILVFDMGANHTNVSVVISEEKIFEVKSVCGNMQLGGEDFVNRMIIHFMKQIQQKYNKDLSQNKRIIRRLRTVCEEAKLNLSLVNETSIEFEIFDENINFLSKITRAEFEEMNEDLFRSTLDLIENALRGARMDKSSINEIVLVGGSTRIPKIQKLIKEFFNGKELNRTINCDEAPAAGAAIYAATLANDASKKIKDLLLLDATTHSLGIETAGGKITKIINHHTTLPHKMTTTFAVRPHYKYDNIVAELVEIEIDERNPMKQLPNMHLFENKNFNIDINIFEGEHSLAKDNHFINRLILQNLSFSSSNIPLIEIVFDINANGVLTVSAMEKSSQIRVETIIANQTDSLSNGEIAYLIRTLREYDHDDTIERERMTAQNPLEPYFVNLKETINQNPSTEASFKTINETIQWLDEHEDAEK